MNTASNSAEDPLSVEDTLVSDRFVSIFPRINQWDNVVINKIYPKMNTTKFGKIAQVVSLFGDPRLWIALLPIMGVVGLIQMDFSLLVIFSTAFFQSMIFYYIIKFYFRRSRPFEVFPSIIRLDKTGHGHGFPSGHCHHSTMMVGLLWLNLFPNPWFLIPLLTYNILIALSRMTSGCHFPSDVIVGTFEAWIELAFYWGITKIWYLGIYESLISVFFG